MPSESATIKDGKVERTGYSNVTPFSGKGYTTGSGDGSNGRQISGNSRTREAGNKAQAAAKFTPFSGQGNVLGSR